jgi:hypothetical protein
MSERDARGPEDHDAQAGIESAIRGYLIGNGKPDFKQLGKRAAIGRPPEAVLPVVK